MKQANGFLAVRFLVALGFVLLCILWAAAQYSGAGRVKVSGPEDLRAELQWAQLLASPGEDDTFLYDAGSFEFAPGGDRDAAVLAEGLVPVAGAVGGTVWPVTLFEDRLTRETVFLNADGAEIGRLSPPDGYDSWWIADALYPEGVSSADAAAACDPSRVVMAVSLLPTGGSAASVSGHTLAPVPGCGPVVFRRAAHTPAGPEPVFLSASGARSGLTLTQRQAAGSRLAGTTNSAPAKARGAQSLAKRAVYVNQSLGKDDWSGRARDASAAGDGPKRTVGAGLSAVRKGERLVIGRGAYAENLDARGKNVAVRFSGNVVLARATQRRAAEGGGAVPVLALGGPTGTVARVAD